MSDANPFKRFAFSGAASPAAPEPKRSKRGDAATASRAVKEEPSLGALARGDPTPDVKTEPQEAARDVRVALLTRLVRAREAMTTPIDEFGTQACVAPHATGAATKRFHVLVAALLSSQTKDEVTHAAMQRLHHALRLRPVSAFDTNDVNNNNEHDNDKEGVTVAKVRAVDEDALDALLNPVGFHRTKARQLKQVAETLHSQHRDDVPQAFDDLVALPGIGPKIARVILLVAWNRVDGLIVDTHVHRLANRLGWTTSPSSSHSAEGTLTAEATRKALEEWVPREHWRGFSRAVVGFGQRVCVAKKPACAACPLADLCPSAFRIEGRVKVPM